MVNEKFYSEIHSGSHDAHNMLQIWAPEFKSGTWFYPQKLYRIDYNFDLINTTGWFNDVNWNIVCQIWGQYPQKWIDGQHPRNPPFAIMARTGTSGEKILRCQLYGQSDSGNTVSDWEYDALWERNVSAGPHTTTIWWKKDHRGLDSRCKVILDGTTLVDVTNVKLGTPFTINGQTTNSPSETTGGIWNLGCYSFDEPSPPGIQIAMTKCQVETPSSGP